MSFVDGLRHRLRVVLRRGRYDDEIAAEARSHIELETMHQRGGGRGDREARAAAHGKFGNLTSIKEETRRVAGFAFLDHLQQDVTYAWRGLRRSPTFAATVIVTFALGIGANGAIFSLLDRVFLRKPAGVVKPGELRRLYKMFPRVQADGGTLAASGSQRPEIDAIRAEIARIAAVAAYRNNRPHGALLVGDARIFQQAEFASANYLPMLGVRPALGRFFTADEDRDTASVLVISHAFWRGAFNAESSVVGRRVHIDKQPYTIIGVTAEGFTGEDLDASDTWQPLGPREGGDIIARLRPGGSVRQLEAGATVAFRRQKYPPGRSEEHTSELQ